MITMIHPIFFAPKRYKGMTDKKMNEFTPATDAAYVYAELGDGSQIKIKKDDLAKTIGEIMLDEKSFPYNTYKWGEWCTDCNTIINSCTISLEAINCANIPNGFTGVGLLSTFALQDGSYIMQFLCGLNNWKLYFRVSANKSNFYDWKLITLT